MAYYKNSKTIKISSKKSNYSFIAPSDLRFYSQSQFSMYPSTSPCLHLLKHVRICIFVYIYDIMSGMSVLFTILLLK